MSPLVLTSGTMGNDGGFMDFRAWYHHLFRCRNLNKTTPNQCSPSKATQPWVTTMCESKHTKALLPFPRRRFPFSRYCINNPTGIDSLNIASLPPRCRSLKKNPQQCTVNVGQQTWVILSGFSWETGWQRNSGIAQYLVCGFVKGNAKHPHQHF